MHRILVCLNFSVQGGEMEVLNQLYPSNIQLERLKSSPDSGEIHLLNLKVRNLNGSVANNQIRQI